MPRPRLRRRIWFKPGITYFKPAGVRLRELAETILTFGEFEAVRLKDYEGLDEKTAAKKMKISQPTFNRTLRAARNKVADAIVNGKAIRIEGGSFKMVRQPLGPGRGMGGRGRGGRGMGGRGRGYGWGGPAISCVCPACGFSVAKQRGVPCNTTICPKCKTRMIRES